MYNYITEIYDVQLCKDNRSSRFNVLFVIKRITTVTQRVSMTENNH